MMALGVVLGLVAAEVSFDVRDCSESAMLLYVQKRVREDLVFCISSGRAGNLSAGGNRLLRTALYWDMFEETTLLLKGGADPNVQEERTGQVPLDWVFGHDIELELMQLLLTFGADPNVRASDGATPFHWASQIGSVEALQLLIDNGANVSAVDGKGRSAVDFAWLREHGEDDRVQVVAFLEATLAEAAGVK